MTIIREYLLHLEDRRSCLRLLEEVAHHLNDAQDAGVFDYSSTWRLLDKARDEFFRLATSKKGDNA